MVAAVAMLGGCSGLYDDLWPTLTGDDPDPRPPVTVAIEPSEEERAATFQPPPPAAPPTRPTQPATAPVTTATAIALTSTSRAGTSQATGTFVGSKVADYQSELAALKTAIINDDARFNQLRQVSQENAQRYYATVAAISARLQIGTTPGNPVLVSQWNTAQSELDRIVTDIAALNSLSNAVSANATMAAFMLEEIRASFAVAGAVEEDHRQLTFLEDEVNRTVVHLDRLLSEMSETISRQTNYVNNERTNLTTLSLAINNGEMFGPSLANRAFAAALAATGPSRSALAPAVAAERRPLVVIRFDRPDVPYQQALYGAVSKALERRPAAVFDIVAVAPNRGTPAEVALNANASKRNAEHVLRSLSEMGLPSDRVNLSATTQASAETNEVHVFVR